MRRRVWFPDAMKLAKNAAGQNSPDPGEQKPVEPEDVSPFGGCTRLLEQYRQTGRSLLTFESRVACRLVPTREDSREFSAGVSFVPVEVLESFLDDLLDLGVSDESLFIRRPRITLRAMALGAIGFTTVALIAMYRAGDSTTIFSPAVLCAVFLAGLGSALYFVPRTRVMRRFSFATVLSREIATRRGQDRTDMGSFATRLLTRDFWQPKEVTRASTAAANRSRISSRYYH